MKRSLSAIPIILFILLNACDNAVGQFSNSQWTAIVETQTATMWTPTISPTPDPSESNIVQWLNAELSDMDELEQLEQTLDARYQVVGVSFPVLNQVATVIRVDVRCECATYGQCCSPERMFVKIIGAMRARQDKIIEQVPASVSWMNLICYDHVTQFQVMSAPWSNVKNYLLGQITGYELGPSIFRGKVP